jgi:hypothetical protein
VNPFRLAGVVVVQDELQLRRADRRGGALGV